MSDGFEVQGLDQLQDISVALKDAADRGVTNGVRAAIRTQTKPAGLRVLRTGAGSLPHRGGLAARVAEQGKVGLQSALVARNLHITMTLSNKRANMRSLNEGLLRHPVFARAGRARTWVRQAVPTGVFTKAFYAEAPRLRDAALQGAQNALDDVARKVRR